VTEHTPTSSHSLVVQSTAHPCVLHAIVCTRSDGHATPPFSAGVITTRVWFSVPPPHSTEQVVVFWYALTTQSTGHPCVLHDS
jgi:hypothetical protein